jgi:predicted outer membrane repeat protein
VQRCRFINNSATQFGGAISLSSGLDIRIENSVFWNNTAGQQGGAIAVTSDARVTLRSCTIASGGAPVGGGVAGRLIARFTFDRTIIAFTGPGTAVGCGQLHTIVATCTDIFGNAGGDWVGCMDGLNGTNGNIAADPRFCGLEVGDLTLGTNSPCSPEHSGACGLIGALPVECGVTAVEPATWGRVKASFR